MFFTEKIEKAILKTAEIHKGQKRKDGLPYQIHPISVALIISHFGGNEDSIIAGLLHDAIEDTAYKENQIKLDFDKKITSIVKEVTEDKKKPWQERKKHYTEHIKTCSYEAKLVSASDKIHNMLSVIRAYRKLGEKFWQPFEGKKEEYLTYWGNILTALKKSWNHKIISEYEKVFMNVKKTFAA